MAGNNDTNKNKKPELICVVEATGSKYYTHSYDNAGNATPG